MTTQSSGRNTPVDHGVQIRFINDLADSGTGQPLSHPKSKTQTTSKYGVAIRVQGIAGQPYVVLKDGKKGDSYGVQLKTNYSSGYRSLPRRKDKAEPGSEGADEGGDQGGALRRAQSHGSLLDRNVGPDSEDFQLARPPGDGKSGSYGNLDGGIGVRGDREGGMESTMWDRAYRTGISRSQESLGDNRLYSYPAQQANEPQSNQRQTTVNRLINRFDGSSGGQQRGVPSAQHHHRVASPHLHPSPYTSPPSSSHSSLGRSQGPISNIPAQSTNQWTSVETQQMDLADTQVKILLFFSASALRLIFSELLTPQCMQHCKSSFLIYVLR